MSRISPGTLTAGIIAVLLALAGAYGLRLYLQPDPEPEPEQVKAPREPLVPVASNDLPVGRKITLGDIAMQPEKAVKDVKPYTISNSNYIIGRVLREPVKLGETFATTNMYPEGRGPTINDMLQPGFRAVTVPVQNYDAVGGYVQVGTMVDVLFRSDRGREQGDYEEIPEVTVTLAEAVEVLAVGKNPFGPQARNQDRREATVLVTLACRQVEANRLRAVEGRGDLALVLRAKEDRPDPALQQVGHQKSTLEAPKVNEPAKDGVTLQDILGVQEKRKPQRTVIYRRGQRSVNEFDDQGQLKNAPPQTTSQVDTLKLTKPAASGSSS